MAALQRPWIGTSETAGGQPTDVREYLRRTQREPMPAWLEQFTPGDPFPREQFFTSRVVFYPGSGYDGHPVKVFGSTHSAHCFLYADDGMSPGEMKALLDDPEERLLGYRTLARFSLRGGDLLPGGWAPHVRPDDLPEPRTDFAGRSAGTGFAASAFLEVLERDPERDETHGPYRLALLLVVADGIAAYDALFCRGTGYPPPFAVVLRDHDRAADRGGLGRGGVLERIAAGSGILPQWLLVCRHTLPWNGYDPVPGLENVDRLCRNRMAGPAEGDAPSAEPRGSSRAAQVRVPSIPLRETEERRHGEVPRGPEVRDPGPAAESGVRPGTGATEAARTHKGRNTRRRRRLTVYDYLRQAQRAPMPAWLEEFTPGDPFPREQFFTSRVVFYPGSGYDGHPVKVFGSTHSAHCFVYVDYGVPRRELERQLAAKWERLPRGQTDRDIFLRHPDDLRGPYTSFRGYRTLARLHLRASDLVPAGWTPHLEPDDIPPEEMERARHHLEGTSTFFAFPQLLDLCRSSSGARVRRGFAFLEILERTRRRTDAHGPRRLAILFVGADGIATYDALFCQGLGHPPPFAVVLQDHGFGGNYNRFAKGGLLERIAIRCGVLPEWLLVARHTEPWDGYEALPGVKGVLGGRFAKTYVRCLYQRVTPDG